MKGLLCVLMLAALACAATSEVDVTGKWSGSFNMTGPNGETNDGTALLVLKQTGSDITGTVGPNEDDRVEIQKGKIEGGKIILEVAHEGATMKFELVLAADRITGDATMFREGQTAHAKINVTRAK